MFDFVDRVFVYLCICSHVRWPHFKEHLYGQADIIGVVVDKFSNIKIPMRVS